MLITAAFYRADHLVALWKTQGFPHARATQNNVVGINLNELCIAWHGLANAVAQPCLAFLGHNRRGLFRVLCLKNTQQGEG